MRKRDCKVGMWVEYSCPESGGVECARVEQLGKRGALLYIGTKYDGTPWRKWYPTRALRQTTPLF